MDFHVTLFQWFLLAPVAGGSAFAVLCLAVFRLFFHRTERTAGLAFSSWPPVTILKPVCGLEKNLRENLRSACDQDYPEFQVIFSVQDPRDPALPILEEIRREYPESVGVVVQTKTAGPNGKVNNLLGALEHARHEFLVISDSDVHLRPDYLRTVIAPLSDPDVAFVCTLYRAAPARRWFEKLELLTLNADFIPSVIFAYVSGASKFCLGSSVAFRRRSLEEIGGLEAVADYLAEDYELGRRLLAPGKRMVLAPYFVDITVDLKNFRGWWDHQISWDQKTRSAQPAGFFAGVITRSVPFAVFFAVSRLADPLGVAVLCAAVAIRLGAAAAMKAAGNIRCEGLQTLALLPFRDLAALISWVLAFTKNTVTWRGSKWILTRRGRLAGPGLPR